MFKNRISAATERRREIEAAKKRPDLGEGGKSVRTSSHGRHFSDVPCGNVCIKSILRVKEKCHVGHQRSVPVCNRTITSSCTRSNI